jgi:hypothetical protein
LEPARESGFVSGLSGNSGFQTMTRDERHDDDLRQCLQRAITAEVRGRQVNEAIQREQGSGVGVFLCECGQLGCSTTIELEIAAYEAIRTDFERFLVAPGHEIETVDEVVERHPAHLVVVKRDVPSLAGEA